MGGWITRRHVRVLAALLAAAGCGGEEDGPGLAASQDDGSGHAAPTAITVQANAAVLEALPFEDRRDFEDARRGWLAQRKDPAIRGANGQVVWDVSAYEFETGDAPDSVNPSLWRQAQLNNIHGLFKVSERIYQVRGYDLANLTLIEGERGWIVIDVLTTLETAQASMELVEEHLGKRPVTGVIYTHSHIDHFGGARALLPDGANGVPVIAPEGFVEESVSENVLAGNTMTRRAGYMFGFLLGRGPREHVDTGLGKAAAPGSYGFVEPNRIITETPTEIVVDGVRMVFQNTPGAEAPAEMMVYLPDMKALCGAENVSHVLHNVYTLRGAKVRDALLWSRYLDETMELFGDAEVLFASHHWPTWGNPRILDYLTKQRDVYRYIHDQTLRMANLGFTPREIAEQIELPPSLARTFAVRGYYGTVRHNSKAVYQHYFGWFDGNPANLDPLPPEESATRYVEFMGGGEALLDKARDSYQRGEYRWVATVLNHLVFAEPDNRQARALLADTYDQLGYQAESGPWRDFYLTGARELREGVKALEFAGGGPIDVISAMPTAIFFDALAVRLNGPDAAERDSLLNFVFTDIDETHVVELGNGVLHHKQAKPHPDADTTVKLTRKDWDLILSGGASLQGKILEGAVDIDGSRLELIRFFSLLDTFEPGFPIVTP